MTDQKTVPDIFKGPTGRMMWEYIFTETGEVRDYINGSHTLEEVLLEVLPYVIKPSPEILENFEKKALSETFDQWMTKNMRGCWQMWAERGDLKNPVYYFEREGDALLFKLRWA